MFVVGFVAMALPVWASSSSPTGCGRVRASELAARPLPGGRRAAPSPGDVGESRSSSASSRLRRFRPVETTWLWFNGVSTSTTDPQFGLDNGFYTCSGCRSTPPPSASRPRWCWCASSHGAWSRTCTARCRRPARAAHLEGRAHPARDPRRPLPAAAGCEPLARPFPHARRAVGAHPPRLRRHERRHPRTDDLAIAAVIVALAFFVTAFLGRWRYPLIGTARCWFVSADRRRRRHPVGGDHVPGVVKRARSREPVLPRNLDGRRPPTASTTSRKRTSRPPRRPTAGQLRNDADPPRSCASWTPRSSARPSVSSSSTARTTSFNTPLDVDRYTINGQTQGHRVSLRELNIGQLGGRGLVAEHDPRLHARLRHGRGRRSRAHRRRRPGLPRAGHPRHRLPDRPHYEPRSTSASSRPVPIVADPRAARTSSSTTRSAPTAATRRATTFAGNAAATCVGNVFQPPHLRAEVPVGADPLFSDYVQLRLADPLRPQPKQRVQKLAPYLTLDSDPYPTVVDGSIKWVIDGYTTSANYPYSSGVSLSAGDRRLEQPGLRPTRWMTSTTSATRSRPRSTPTTAR